MTVLFHSRTAPTMLLEHDSLGRKIADWLHVGTTTEHRFAVGDETFAAGTAEPTRDGSVTWFSSRRYQGRTLGSTRAS